jgi:hypothetical protein
MRLEHLLDPRGARASFDSCHRAVAFHEHERRHRFDAEPVCELRLLVDVDACSAQARALLSGEMGEQSLEERPVVREGEVVVRPVGNVSVTFDHRVIYGKRAAEFGLDVIRRLEGGAGATGPA